MALSEILQQVTSLGARHVTVTGGEPLAQPECLPLLTQLADAGFSVSLETSGALDVGTVDERISRIMDLKTPSSGESHRNLYSNIAYLNMNDEVKFVIGSEDDFRWSESKMIEYALADRVGAVLFSPVHEQLAPSQLAQWVLQSKLPVRFQLQLHKYLWSDARGK